MIALVLLSGGLDSATTSAIAKDHGYELYALTIRYGQRHEIETQAAVAVARHFDVRQHRLIDIDLRVFGASALTSDAAVPKNRSAADMGGSVPITYVPARNTIFLSYALAYAEVCGIRDIFIGVNAVDYSGYPDCRPEYIAAFERMARLATKAGIEGSPVTIHTPLIHMTKAEIIRMGARLGVDYGMTWSCYDPLASGNACGECDSCLLRKRGFIDAGVPDPTVYG